METKHCWVFEHIGAHIYLQFAEFSILTNVMCVKFYDAPKSLRHMFKFLEQQTIFFKYHFIF
jgi:hypothetical protein